MTRMERFGYDVWALVKDYWMSHEGWFAWPCLAAIIGLDMAFVYINVRLNIANGVVFNALQQTDSTAFFRAFASILVLILFILVAVLLRTFMVQTLQLRWRRWLTDRYLTHRLPPPPLFPPRLL